MPGSDNSLILITTFTFELFIIGVIVVLSLDIDEQVHPTKKKVASVSRQKSSEQAGRGERTLYKSAIVGPFLAAPLPAAGGASSSPSSEYSSSSSSYSCCRNEKQRTTTKTFPLGQQLLSGRRPPMMRNDEFGEGMMFERELSERGEKLTSSKSSSSSCSSSFFLADGASDE